MTPFPRADYGSLSPYAPDRRPIALDLSDNTNRWGTHPAALEAVRAADPDDLIRYPSVYADALRDAVARRFGVPAAAVATGCGSDDLLDSGFRAICEPGEAVAYLPPTFSMIEIFARMNGLRAVPVHPTGPAGVLPDPEALIRAAGSGTDPSATTERGRGLVYVCRPNNPTGEVQPRSWMERLIELAEDDGPVILVDEAYADYAGESLIETAARSTRVVVLRTLSKAYGLAGLRIGFAVGAPGVVGEIEKSRGPYKVGRIGERAAVAALDDVEGWVPDITARTCTERSRLFESLRSRGLDPLPSGANFILLPVGMPGAAEVTAALRQEGVAVRPFPDLPGPGDCIRITIGPRPEMDRFLDALFRLPTLSDR